MATRKPKVPESEWPWPPTGGSWRRNPQTGELTPLDAPADTDNDNQEADDGEALA